MELFSGFWCNDLLRNGYCSSAWNLSDALRSPNICRVCWHLGSGFKSAGRSRRARACSFLSQSDPSQFRHRFRCCIWPATTKLASRFGVSKDTVQRILTQADVRPHRLERYLASDDPDFETKAADVIGLYLAPPQHTAVFCVDEKTAIQALDRLDPVLPLSPGRLERHGFEYCRNGTLSLYAALDVKTGKVQGKTAERHTSAAFIEFLEQLVSTCKTRQEIHIILDNLSAHKTAKVTAFLERNPNVKLHFTPTYSSWLNQVEIWFSRLEREVIARGIFTSVNDLARKLMRYIRAYSKTARPFKWKYSDLRRRILPC